MLNVTAGGAHNALSLPLNYDTIAPAYDLLASAYTLGGIRKAKHAHLSLITSGDRVLYVGAGSGEECVGAAQLGAQVTVVDSSEKMVNLCRRRFSRARQQGEFIVEDVLACRAAPLMQTFDVVVAPFFLNIFSTATLADVMSAIVCKVRSGGRFICVDFRAPAGGRFFQALQRFYYLPPLALFYLFAENPWHALYDYRKVAQEAQLPLRLSANIIEKAWGMPVLETLIWDKQ